MPGTPIYFRTYTFELDPEIQRTLLVGRRLETSIIMAEHATPLSLMVQFACQCLAPDEKERVTIPTVYAREKT